MAEASHSRHVFIDGRRVASVEGNGLGVLGDMTVAGIKYHHSNGVGSILAVTGSAGNLLQRVYAEPFGLQQDAQDDSGVGIDPALLPSDYSFGGKELDPWSGFSYFEARYYDSEAGIFLSPDPALLEPTRYESFDRVALEPGLLATHGYAVGRPTVLIDPSGRSVDLSALDGDREDFIDQEMASEGPDEVSDDVENITIIGKRTQPRGTHGVLGPARATPKGTQVAALPLALAGAYALGEAAKWTAIILGSAMIVDEGSSYLAGQMQHSGEEGAEEGRGADGQTDAQRDTDQEADIEAEQAAKQKVGKGEEIRDISKSRQRARARRDRIRTLEDALEDFGDD